MYLFHTFCSYYSHQLLNPVQIRCIDLSLQFCILTVCSKWTMCFPTCNLIVINNNDRKDKNALNKHFICCTDPIPLNTHLLVTECHSRGQTRISYVISYSLLVPSNKWIQYEKKYHRCESFNMYSNTSNITNNSIVALV